jgi:hypothetical protein
MNTKPPHQFSLNQIKEPLLCLFKNYTEEEFFYVTCCFCGNVGSIGININRISTSQIPNLSISRGVYYFNVDTYNNNLLIHYGENYQFSGKRWECILEYKGKIIWIRAHRPNKDKGLIFEGHLSVYDNFNALYNILLPEDQEKIKSFHMNVR